MKADDIIIEIRKRGGEVIAAGPNKLEVRPATVLDDELRKAIRARKPELLRLAPPPRTERPGDLARAAAVVYQRIGIACGAMWTEGLTRLRTDAHEITSAITKAEERLDSVGRAYFAATATRADVDRALEGVESAYRAAVSALEKLERS